MPSRMVKRVAPDKEGATDKQCQGKEKLWFSTRAYGARLAIFRQIHLGEGQLWFQTRLVLWACHNDSRLRLGICPACEVWTWLNAWMKHLRVQWARRRLQHRAVEHEQGTVRHIRCSGHPLHPNLSPVVLTMSCHCTQIGKDERVRLTTCATLPHYNLSHAQVTTFSAVKSRGHLRLLRRTTIRISPQSLVWETQSGNKDVWSHWHRSEVW